MRRDQRRLFDVTFLAFDTETTGLSPIMHRLVAIGAGRFRLDGHELATFQSLMNTDGNGQHDARSRPV
jgi:DNA polymerase III epsilon subunit-like protein